MKTKKITVSVFQILIFLLIVCIIATITITISIKFQKDNTVAEIKEESISLDGLGTQDNPYLIKNVADLEELASSVNNGKSYQDRYFSMVNNIDLTESVKFSSIGGDTTSNNKITVFSGILDGNDKTITTNTDTKFSLFGNNSGTIKNLKINVQINITENITGEELKIATLCIENSGNIENCKVEGTISTNEVVGTERDYISALVGENTGKIVDSSSLVNITSSFKKAGISIINKGVITNCTNSGIIKEDKASSNYTVGVVYQNEGTLTSCTNSGVIQGYLASGVAGFSMGALISCQNTGEISNIDGEVPDVKALCARNSCKPRS